MTEVNVQLQKEIALNHIEQQRVLLTRKKAILEDIFIKNYDHDDPARTENVRKDLGGIEYQLKNLKE